jgi:hypothetical protein
MSFITDFLIPAVIFLALGWTVISLPIYEPPVPLVCSDTFYEIDINPKSSIPDPSHTVVAELQEGHPQLVAVYQIIDTNGFGWLTQSLGERLSLQRELPFYYPVTTIRVGLMRPDDHERARALEAASRRFDTRGWLNLQGWQNPHVTICYELHMNPGEVQ